MPFPSVFGRIDRAMKEFYEGKPTSVISSGTLNAGVIKTKKLKIASEPTSYLGLEIILSGEMDAAIEYENGSEGIIDFKTSSPESAMKPPYWRQLATYRYIREHPDKKQSPKRNSSMALLSVCPIEMVRSTEGLALIMQDSYLPIEVDRSAYAEFIKEAVGVLAMPLDRVRGKEDCPFCAMQRALGD